MLRFTVYLLMMLLIVTPGFTEAQQTQPLNGKIVFVSDRDGNAEIYSMLPDGTNIQRLTFNERGDYEPDWSPDGSKIVFTSFRENVTSDIYIMDADGSNVVNITNSPDIGNGYPSWSPDGTRIAFTQMMGDSSDIYVINIDGTGLLKVADGQGEMNNLMPTWSPDGTEIMFTSINELPIYTSIGGYIVEKVNADGSSRTRVTSGYIGPNGNLDWSWANGNVAYYDSWGEATVIYTATSDFSDFFPVTLTSEDGLFSHKNPSWSPDGAYIAFDGPSFTGQSVSDDDIFIVDLNTGVFINITEDFASDDFEPDWGPAFVANADTD